MWLPSHRIQLRLKWRCCWWSRVKRRAEGSGERHKEEEMERKTVWAEWEHVKPPAGRWDSSKQQSSHLILCFNEAAWGGWKLIMTLMYWSFHSFLLNLYFTKQNSLWTKEGWIIGLRASLEIFPSVVINRKQESLVIWITEWVSVASDVWMISGHSALSLNDVPRITQGQPCLKLHWISLFHPQHVGLAAVAAGKKWHMVRSERSTNTCAWLGSLHQHIWSLHQRSFVHSECYSASTDFWCVIPALNNTNSSKKKKHFPDARGAQKQSQTIIYSSVILISLKSSKWVFITFP